MVVSFADHEAGGVAPSTAHSSIRHAQPDFIPFMVILRPFVAFIGRAGGKPLTGKNCPPARCSTAPNTMTPVFTQSSTQFGRITSTRPNINPRQTQLGLKINV
jgi:hypothetical protein